MLLTMSAHRLFCNVFIGLRGLIVAALIVTAGPSQALNLGDMSVAPGMAADFYVRVDYTGDATRTDEWVTLGESSDYEALGLQLPAFFDNAEIKFFQTAADKGYLTVRAYRKQADSLVDVVFKQSARAGSALSHYRILESQNQVSVTRRNMLMLKPVSDARGPTSTTQAEPIPRATAPKAKAVPKPADVSAVESIPASSMPSAATPAQLAPTIINLPDTAFVREPAAVGGPIQNNAQVVSDVLLAISHDQFYVGALLLLLAISGLSYWRVIDRERQGRAYQMGYAQQRAGLIGGDTLSPFAMSPAAPQPPRQTKTFEEFFPVSPAPASVAASTTMPKPPTPTPTPTPAPVQAAPARSVSPAAAMPGAPSLSAFDQKKMELQQRLNQQLMRMKSGDAMAATGSETAPPVAASPPAETKQSGVSRETAQTVELAMVYRRMGDLGTARALLQRLLDSCDSAEKPFVKQSLELIDAL